MSVVLITGASRGIGRATAIRLAESGHTVYATMPDPDEWVAEVQNSLKIRYIDVTNESSIDDAISEIVEVEGHLDVLINNAGIAIFGTAETISIEQAKYVFDINFFGVLRMVQASIPIMRKQRNGLIINLSSVNGIRPSPGYDIYSSSKFALEGLSEALAGTLASWNIRVVLIQPGLVTTNFIDTALNGDRVCDERDPYDGFIERCKLRIRNRFSTGQSPEEVADFIETIIKTPEPSFRYQTSDSSKNTAKMKFLDPTGDKMIQLQREVLEKLLKCESKV